MPSQLERTDDEMCCDCENPTGRAGKEEDSLYCPACGDGPFCETCYDVHIMFNLPNEMDAFKNRIKQLESDCEYWRETAGHWGIIWLWHDRKDWAGGFEAVKKAKRLLKDESFITRLKKTGPSGESTIAAMGEAQELLGYFNRAIGLLQLFLKYIEEAMELEDGWGDALEKAEQYLCKICKE